MIFSRNCLTININAQLLELSATNCAVKKGSYMIVFIVIFGVLVLVLGGTLFLRNMAQKPDTPEGVFYFGKPEQPKEYRHGKDGYKGKSDFTCSELTKEDGRLDDTLNKGEEK